MSEVITGELRFLAVSILWGGGIAACYEALRLCRLMLRHGELWTGLEDLLFWTICAILIFTMVMEENDGLLRWYVIAGCVAGACIYQFFLHPLLVFLLRPLLIPARFFRRIVRNLLKKRQKSVTLKHTDDDEAGKEEGKGQDGQIRKPKKEKTEQAGHVRHRAGRGRAPGRPGPSDHAPQAAAGRIRHKTGIH